MNGKYILGGVLILICIGVGIYSLKSSMTPYVSFDEARTSGRTVQVAGTLVKETTSLDKETGEYVFQITDNKGDKLKVRTSENLPSNFSQSDIVVAIGDYADNEFAAGRVLVKCPSKYEKEQTGKTHPGELPK